MKNKKNHLIRVHKDDIAKIELVYDLPKTSKDQKASKDKDSKNKQKGSASYFKRFILHTRTEEEHVCDPDLLQTFSSLIHESIKSRYASLCVENIMRS